ncbi:MAG TPA: MlaD family protein [Streptosporangiaceae bacterium]|nr:MlaD family protein [Streptosporangiaceae bacterium]
MAVAGELMSAGRTGPPGSRRPRRGVAGRVARRAVLTAAVAAVIAAAIAIQRAAAPGSYVLRIPTDDASGIYAGSDVMIAGVNAGTVRSVSLGPGGEAVITAAISPSFAPVHSSATAQLRPKSLLGEMYVDLTPGTSGPVLPSGAALPELHVNRSTDLQQVINTFNGPTRAKLRTLVDELGGGLTGRGDQLNQSIPSGRNDVSDLASITSTLNAKDAELKTVISTLNTVTTELAHSDRRQQLGSLISSADQLVANLRTEQANLQSAVVSTDHSLGSLQQGLQGTAPALNQIVSALPETVQAGTLLLAPLDVGTDVLMPQVGTLVQGIKNGPVVFGGRDADGYATRISLVLGCGSISLCPQLTSPLSGAYAASGSPGGARGTAGSATSPAGRGKGSSGDQGILGFLLGGSGSSGGTP